MTEEQIVKALECCIVHENCEGCPCAKDNSLYCLKATCKNALDLINSQRAELERLKNAYKQCAWERDVFAEDCKSGAIKEYKEKVKAILMDKGIYPVVVKNALDEAEKEMVGESNV